METDTQLAISTRAHILICASTGLGGAMVEPIRAHGGSVVVVDISGSIVNSHVRTLLPTVDIVLLDLTKGSHAVLNTLRELNAAIGICAVRPRILCFSTVYRNPDFVLSVEKCGTRYVRISNPAMLLEAVDLVLAETNDFKRKGPPFQIVHRFSHGICAPGEELSAVLLTHGGNFFQLPLSLSQRFLFNFLAQRRIALDSLQIVSGLSGDWFYRDHASNSGQRQRKTIRRATVKVHVQRIREAMAATFAKAQLRFDPYDVLRSIPAEGSKRSLYKLHADVTWHHENG